MQTAKAQNERQEDGQNAADRAGLERLGFIFGGITAVVMLITVILVHNRVGAKVSLETASPILPVSLALQSHR